MPIPQASDAGSATSEALMLGGCLCGAVSYELEPPFAFASHCHCASCRRAHGAAFVSWVTVRAPQLRVVGGGERLVGFASSPGARRSFCGTCGSHLFMRYDDEPAWVWIVLGTLTTPPERAPDRHYSFEERVAWFPFQDELPKLRGKSDEVVDVAPV
jgi:hypothetical protein